jgi:hypothetical protein
LRFIRALSMHARMAECLNTRKRVEWKGVARPLARRNWE